MRSATGVDKIEVDASLLGPRVIIIGQSQEACEAARERLEYVTERIPVAQEQIGWLIGRGGSNFRELQEKTKVTRLNVDRTSHEVILVGTKQSVEAATLYMETQIKYYDDLETEASETDKLRRELRGMDPYNDDEISTAAGLRPAVLPAIKHARRPCWRYELCSSASG